MKLKHYIFVLLALVAAGAVLAYPQLASNEASVFTHIFGEILRLERDITQLSGAVLELQDQTRQLYQDLNPDAINDEIDALYAMIAELEEQLAQPPNLIGNLPQGEGDGPE